MGIWKVYGPNVHELFLAFLLAVAPEPQEELIEKILDGDFVRPEAVHRFNAAGDIQIDFSNDSKFSSPWDNPSVG